MDEVQGESEARKEAVLKVLPPRTRAFNAVIHHENSFFSALPQTATAPNASPA